MTKSPKISLKAFDALSADEKYAEMLRLDQALALPRAKERTLSGARLIDTIRRAESQLAKLGLAKKDWAGVHLAVTPGEQAFPSSYKYPINFTRSLLVRQASGSWVLTSVSRQDCYQSIPGSKLILNEAQKSIAIANFSRDLGDLG